MNEVGDTLSYGALTSFIQNLGPDSSLAREINPDAYEWAMTTKTNSILADIFDVLSSINSNLCAIGSGKRASKPQTYPRPKKKEDNKYGFKAEMSAAEFRNWLNERRRNHAGQD